MKKQYKWLVKNGRIILLRRTVGLFGEQWDCIGNFDNKGNNAVHGKMIIKLLNECAQNTTNLNRDD